MYWFWELQKGLPIRIFAISRFLPSQNLRNTQFLAIILSERARFKPQLPQGQRTLQDFFPALRTNPSRPGGEQPTEIVG
jgi:hypothetical protein